LLLPWHVVRHPPRTAPLSVILVYIVAAVGGGTALVPAGLASCMRA
jgi:hypothetical protein